MKRFISPIVVAACVVGVASGCRGWETDKPPVHLMWNMDTQEKGKAYRNSDFFADGRMMRQPVEGTVARGHLGDDDAFSRGKNADGKFSTLFPEQFAGSSHDMERGHERFNIYCTPCHGAAGDGKGNVAYAFAVKPASLLSDRVKTLPNGQLFDAITNGVNNGNMPGYAAQIPESDRWAIVFYLRALQKSVDANQEVQGNDEQWAKYTASVFGPADTSVGPSVKKGEAKFKMACLACHSIDGTRIVGPTFKGLYGKTEKTSAGDVLVDDAYLTESILNPGAKIVNDYPPAMPPQTLTDEEIKSMILYIQSLK